MTKRRSLHKSGIFDVILESAVTTIVDFEDSASTVSDEEKIHATGIILGLMKRELSQLSQKVAKLLRDH